MCKYRFVLVSTTKANILEKISSNYRGIKTLSHALKLFERVIEHGLRARITTSKKDFSILLSWSTKEACIPTG